jgi:hypothetical protein
MGLVETLRAPGPSELPDEPEALMMMLKEHRWLALRVFSDSDPDELLRFMRSSKGKVSWKFFRDRLTEVSEFLGDDTLSQWDYFFKNFCGV